ncbi:hypothetical protein BCD67_17265 [Oscillatoriales cyanobacterium USR001]|nr:hypothetical protein BCD67_17265 [Oscillatoriales cyanobacterium USR001]
MKIKTFVILGSLFASLGIFSATTVLAQGKVENYRGEEHLFLPKGEELGPSVRCSRDGRICSFLEPADCDGRGCYYRFLPPTTETVFRNPIWANACWGFGSTAEYILGSNPGIDCRVYGMSNQMFEEKKRQAEYTKRQLDESLRRLQQTGN